MADRTRSVRTARKSLQPLPMNWITAALASAATAVSLSTSTSPAYAESHYGGYDDKTSHRLSQNESRAVFDIRQHDCFDALDVAEPQGQALHSGNRDFGYRSGHYFGW